MHTLPRSTRHTTQPQSRGGRACGPQSPHIARIEAFVEFIVVLQDDARLMERGARALRVICDAHERNRIRFEAGEIPKGQFECDARELDRIEQGLSNVLSRRSRHLKQDVIPEVRELYRVAEQIAC